MRPTKSARVYNILLPIWLLVWFPSILWVLLIPANYLIDYLVLRWSLSERDDRGLFCRKHAWKVCLVGFASDFVASLILFGAYALDPFADTMDPSFSYALAYDPLSNLLALPFLLLCIAVAGVLIYLLDRWVLTRSGLDEQQAKASALRLAVLTAPYLFLVPGKLLW